MARPPIEEYGDHPFRGDGTYGSGYKIVKHPPRWVVSTNVMGGEDRKYFRTQEEANAENSYRAPEHRGRVLQVPAAYHVIDNTDRIANASSAMREHRM